MSTRSGFFLDVNFHDRLLCPDDRFICSGYVLSVGNIRRCGVQNPWASSMHVQYCYLVQARVIGTADNLPRDSSMVCQMFACWRP